MRPTIFHAAFTMHAAFMAAFAWAHTQRKTKTENAMALKKNCNLCNSNTSDSKRASRYLHARFACPCAPGAVNNARLCTAGGRWRWLDCCVRCVWCECTVERPVETWRGLPASIARARWPWTLQMPQRGRALSLLVPRAQSWRGRAIMAPNNPPPKRAFCTYRMNVELNSTLRLRATAADDVLISIATPYGHTGRALRVRRA
jgi:hypothetical protein